MSIPLQKIYSVFALSPLRPDQQAMYVNLGDVRSDPGMVRGMAQKIRLSDEPTCQVLTGHRGSGKSTELGRLCQDLENPIEGEAGYFVVRVQADDELDRNDIDFPEVLIAIVRQMAAQLRERQGIKPKPGYFRDRWERLKKLALGEVSFEGLDLETGMATVSTTVKNSPDARSKVREVLEPDTNNWLTAANDVIGEAIQGLRKKGLRGLCVIVDDLDKMITRPHASAGCSTTEYLFVHRSSQLTAFHCHLIYTLPIDLAYSHHEPTIKRLYSGLPVVPMTKIASPPPRSRTYKPGVQKFRDVIDVRLHSVGAGREDLFDRLSHPAGAQQLTRALGAPLPSRGLLVGLLCRGAGRGQGPGLLALSQPSIRVRAGTEGVVGGAFRADFRNQVRGRPAVRGETLPHRGAGKATARSRAGSIERHPAPCP